MGDNTHCCRSLFQKRLGPQLLSTGVPSKHKKYFVQKSLCGTAITPSSGQDTSNDGGAAVVDVDRVVKRVGRDRVVRDRVVRVNDHVDEMVLDAVGVLVNDHVGEMDHVGEDVPVGGVNIGENVGLNDGRFTDVLEVAVAVVASVKESAQQLAMNRGRHIFRM